MIRLDIIKTNPGDTVTGDYDFTVYLPSRKIEGKLKRFDRSRGWAALVKEVAEAAELQRVAGDLEAIFFQPGRCKGKTLLNGGF